MEPWVVVLGGGIYQVPLIENVKRRGYRALVVGPSGYPGNGLAHLHLIADTTNFPELLSALDKFEVAAVVTAGTDVAVPSLAHLVETIGLSGPSVEAAEIASNKVLAKSSMKSAGVPTADFIVPRDIEELVAWHKRKGSLPIVVKPSDSSGSRGVSIVNTESEIPWAIEQARRYSRSGDIVAEEFLSGEEFGAQAVIRSSTSTLRLYPHSDKMLGTIPVGHTYPSGFSKSLTNEVFSITKKLVTQLNINNTVINLDFIATEDGVKVLEFGLRAGATGIPEIISKATGRSFYDEVIDIALGMPGAGVELAPLRSASYQVIMPEKAGVLRKFDCPLPWEGDNSGVTVSRDLIPGAKVRSPSDGSARLGHVLGWAETKDQSEQLVEETLRRVVIEVD